MDEATIANGAAGSAGAAAAAAESEVEALESTPFDRAATKKRLEAKLRADKETRLKAAKNKKSKPGGAHAYVWKYFQTYVQTQLQCYAICKLCLEQEQLGRAEVSYKGSPTNLKTHLNTQYPGHQEAYADVQRQKEKEHGRRMGGSVVGSGSIGAGASTGDATLTVQPTIGQFFSSRTTSWHQALVRWMAMAAIPFSMLNDVNFRSMVSAIRHGACVPTKRACIDIMRNVKGVMIDKITSLLKGEHVCITTDGWTSCANDTYMSLTLSLVTRQWRFVTISVDCSKSVGTTTGEALAEGIRASVAKHYLQGQVTALTTDCEPSMVKAGRILEETESFVHIGCCNHRLESTTSIVFNGPGVKKVMTLSRGLVARYSQSSQMVDRLAIFVTTYLEGAERKKVIQDVSTRWWSTYSMVARLLELRTAIEKHEEGDKVDPMLTAADWAVLKLIRPILEPFMTAQKLLEGAKYVTGSLVVPCIYDLRNDLDDAIDELEDGLLTSPDSDDADINAARAAVMPCVTAPRADFANRWGEESDILNYKEGLRRQPRGFKMVQVLATALDPRTKLLYGIADDVKPQVWKLVQDEAVKIAVAKRQKADAAASTSPRSSPAAVAPSAAAAGGSRKRTRGGGGFMAAIQSAGRATGQDGGGGDSSTRDLIAGSVQLEVESFQKCDLLMMFREDSNGDKTFLDPLDWWRLKNADFPHLATLARRVLAIPATQAESERLFSCAGNIVTKNRNGLAPENVELLVLLRHSWERVEQWEKSTVAERCV